MVGSVVQLYIHNVIQSVNTCTAFCCYKCTHFAWPSLLYKLTLPTYTHGAHTVFGSVALLYIHTLVQSMLTMVIAYTTALYNSTLHSASLANVLLTNHRRASVYLLGSDWSIRHRPLILATILIAAC